ncbi:MAG: sulfotransferase family protein [Gaiellales bacterium]
MPARALFILGVRRSGTTLLRVMLGRNSCLAVPDESYFIPQLAARHRGTIDPAAFEDDLRRLATVRDWGVEPSEVRARLRPGATVAEGISAVFEVCAEHEGKPRWGDKTPMYMGYLPLLERLFPQALFVHLVRDGRDAACSFLDMPDGIVTRTWAHRRTAAGFACQWRTEVDAADGLAARVGRDRFLEVSYEALVHDPAGHLRRICAFAGLPDEPGMTGYPGTLDLSASPHLARLDRAPTPNLRDWRIEMRRRDVAAFERIAGQTLVRHGYELGAPTAAQGLVERSRLLVYGGRAGAWRVTGTAMQRSPLWRRTHPVLQPRPPAGGDASAAAILRRDHQPPGEIAVQGAYEQRRERPDDRRGHSKRDQELGHASREAQYHKAYRDPDRDREHQR